MRHTRSTANKENEWSPPPTPTPLYHAPLTTLTGTPLPSSSQVPTVDTDLHPNTLRASKDMKLKLSVERQRHETLEKEARNTRRRERRLRASIEELEDQLHVSKARAEATVAALSAAKVQLEWFQAENASLRGSLMATHHTASFAAWAAQDALARARADVVAACDDAAEAQAEVKTAHEATAAAQAECTRAVPELETCTAEVDRLRAYILVVEAQGASALQAEQERSEQALADANTDYERRMNTLERQYRAALCEADTYLDQTRQLMASHSNSEATRVQFEAAMEESEARLLARAKTLERRNEALRKKVERFPSRRAHLDVNDTTSAPVLRLKEKGAVPDHIRTLVRGLVAQGLKITQVKGVLEAVAGAVGVSVEGSISDRTIRRIVQEGWVLSVMQIVQEIKSAEGNRGKAPSDERHMN